MEKPYVVGIDIGGQTAKIGLVDARGNVLVQTAIKSNDTEDYKAFIKTLCDAVIRLIGKEYSLSEIRGIGVGAPNANYNKGTIEGAVNLTWGGANQVIPFSEYMSKTI
ncbi:MAG: ROK family protein, partial [Paludibacteraceae bacterium]|nr:ROK family protein [Paludibacteraceae bacterium]